MPRNDIGRALAKQAQDHDVDSLAVHDPADPIADNPIAGQEPAVESPRMTAKAKTMPVKVTRDYWAHDDASEAWPSPSDNRIAAGTVIKLPIAEAKRMFATGTAERADPLPEE
jgi:hypothetical protein